MGYAICYMLYAVGCIAGIELEETEAPVVRGFRAPHTPPPPAQVPGLPSTLQPAARAGRMAHGSAPAKKPPAEEEFEDFQTEGAPCSLHRLQGPQPRRRNERGACRRVDRGAGGPQEPRPVGLGLGRRRRRGRVLRRAPEGAGGQAPSTRQGGWSAGQLTQRRRNAALRSHILDCRSQIKSTISTVKNILEST